MCDVVGCLGGSGTKVPSTRGVTVALCDVHGKAKADWLRCPDPQCRVVVRVGKDLIGSQEPRPHGPDQYLCSACEDRALVECAGCRRIATIDGTSVIPGTIKQTTPVTRLFCGTCVAETFTQCAGCRAVLTVGKREVQKPRDLPGGVKLCGTCASAPPTRCGGCARLVLAGQHVVVDCQPYHGGAFHLCKDRCVPKVTASCKLCGTPTMVGTAKMAGAESLGGTDGQPRTWRCKVCATGWIRELPQVTPVTEVLTFMRDWVLFCGATFTPFTGRLTLSLAEDGALTSVHGGQTYGVCTPLGVGTTSTYTVRLLSHLPPLRFQQTLVHELTHAVTHELGMSARRDIEGFCNYAAYLFLSGIRDTGGARGQEAAWLLGQLEQDSNPVYGVAFRAMRDRLQSTPRQAFTHLRDSPPST
jgi:hypothetical protein